MAKRKKRTTPKASRKKKTTAKRKRKNEQPTIDLDGDWVKNLGPMDLVTLRVAAELWAPKVNGKRLTYSSFYRWARAGQLKTVSAGNRWLTCKAWFDEFFESRPACAQDLKVNANDESDEDRTKKNDKWRGRLKAARQKAKAG